MIGRLLQERDRLHFNLSLLENSLRFYRRRSMNYEANVITGDPAWDQLDAAGQKARCEQEIPVLENQIRAWEEELNEVERQMEEILQHAIGGVTRHKTQTL